MMLIGWGTLAVPTGIVVTAEMTVLRHALDVSTPRVCEQCGIGDHALDVGFCRHCGSPLRPKA